MLQCFRRILSRTRSGSSHFDESVVPGVFVGDRRFPEVVYVNVSRSYQAAHQFIRQVDRKIPCQLDYYF